jgi:CHAT domain-containing protein
MRAKNVFLPRSALEGSVKELQANLTDSNRPFDHKIARGLYLQLIQPVRQLIHGERLLILPHDLLSSVPFEVLEDPADGTPLGERFQLAYAPSATVYTGLRPWSGGADKKLTTVADPDLEADGHEAERVAAVYHAAGGQPKGRLITKRKLWDAVRGAAVVHLSVHGTFNGAEPLLSYVILAPSGADDGHLTAAEMFGLPLGKAALVVLSACESGRLDTSRGNEELGMIRGLIYAGAGAAVLSRWRVDAASTAQWMEAFHREAQTHGLAEAARAARRALRADPKYQHPFYWAAFSLVGRQS